MINEGNAPMVPVAGKHRPEEARQRECHPNMIQEDIDALKVGTPFVPVLSRKKATTVMHNSD